MNGAKRRNARTKQIAASRPKRFFIALDCRRLVEANVSARGPHSIELRARWLVLGGTGPLPCTGSPWRAGASSRAVLGVDDDRPLDQVTDLGEINSFRGQAFDCQTSDVVGFSLGARTVSRISTRRAKCTH